MTSAAAISYSKGFFIIRACAALLIFFLFSTRSFGQDAATVTPDYNWIDYKDLATVTARFSLSCFCVQANTEDIRIAVDTDNVGNLYVLSFGKGVDKFDEEGNSIDSNFISESLLDNPLDMAVDESGFIYIVDYLASGEFFDNGKIKIFDPSGNLISSRTILTSFYRPIGLDVDESKVYVAEFNDGNSGPESTRMSRIRIYDKFTGAVLGSTDQVDAPFRIAVDSQKNVYVSQAGNNNPQLLKFDPTLSTFNIFSNIDSPGSVVVDNYDFIHVLEYSNRVDFEKFINYEELGANEALELYNEIDQGIENNEFKIKIFDQSRTLVRTLTDNANNDLNIEFPVDLTFNECQKIYTINANTEGSASLDFDLEIYERSPSNDIETPLAQCISEVELQLVNGSASLNVDEVDNGSTDNCGIETITLSKNNFTTAGTETVVMTVTDLAGNESSCNVEVTITGEEVADEPPSFADCPSENFSLNSDPGQCGAVVTFPTPTASDEDGSVEVVQTEGLASGSEFPVGTTTITFSATDDEDNTTDCSFSIIVADHENPTISCPEDRLETVAFGENAKIINYTVDYDDNCGVVNFAQTSGQASGSEFPLGDTVNTFIVTDDSGKTATCSFTVTIEEEPDSEDPVISCPDNILVNNDLGECGAVVEFQDVTATDNSGTATVSRTDDTGYDSGDLFPIGVTTIEYRATDEAGNVSECSFTVTVEDDEYPVISCPSDITETAAFGTEGKVVEYDLPVTEDNCSGETIIRTEGIASGDVFPIGTTLIVFEVTDAAGNTNTCSFNVTIEEAEDTEDPVFDCPENPLIVSNSPGSCSGNVVVEFPTATDNSGEQPAIRQITDYEIDGSAEFPVGDTTLIFEAEDAAGNTSRCEIIVKVEDNEEPIVNCVSEHTITLSEGETRTLESDDLDAGSQDNCGITSLSLSKDTFTEADEGTVPVILTALDAAGNTSSCEVLIEVVVTTEETLIISCPGDYDVFATENCQYVVPDFSEIVDVSPEGAAIDQSIPPGNTTITNADPFITITATYEGQTETCDIYLLLQDEIDPVVNCPGDKSVSLAEGETYTLPDYRIELSASDNCEIVLVEQQPVEGTVIENDTEINFTITDESGNSAVCSFMLEVLNETELSVNCPADKVESLDENCSFEIPDYRIDAEVVNGEGATLTQTPEPGTLVTGNQVEISIRAERDAQFDECSFLVKLEDNTAPQVVCRDYEIFLEEGQMVELDPQLLDNGSDDNCGDVEFSLDKTQFTAADEGENTVTLTVTDLGGNTSFCEAVVLVTVSNTDVNQQPVPMDEEYTTTVNTTLNVSVENGVLVNDTDPDGDELTAILDTTTEFGTLELNPDGSFTYTPDSDFVGQDFFTYQASDGELSSDIIFVSINVVDNNADFTCNYQVMVQLNEEGVAEVDVQELYQGNAEGLTFSVNELVFGCEDLGETSISLDYSGRLEGSCEITVMVMDQIPPQLNVKDISIDLDLEGNASISFEDIDEASSDNCEANYSLSQTQFTCEDLGINTIEVTATDSEGNSSMAFVQVSVFAEKGICSEPLPGSEYIFLYPNPTSGSFKIATPGDVSIQRIEIFDNRGRFIAAKDYKSNETEYGVILMPLQEAVYVLKIETNQGEVLRRLIYKR